MDFLRRRGRDCDRDGSGRSLGAAQCATGHASSGHYRRRGPRRRGDRTERAGSRRLGDRGDHRPADQIRQDRRHRRPGPLRAARTAEGELQRVGARLWPGGFAEGAERARQDRQPHGGGGAECGGGGGVLSGDLLVFDAENPGQEPVPRHRSGRQRHGAGGEEPGSMARQRQDQQLPRLSPDGQQIHAHDSGGVRGPGRTPSRPGRGASSPARR